MRYLKLAAHALIKKDDKYLFTRRAKTNDYLPGIWDIPGGTIEFGEDILKALIREVKEETSLKIKPKKIIFAYGYISETDKNRHQFQLVYECDYVSGDIFLNQLEHDKYAWGTLNEIKNFKKAAFLKNLSEYK